MSVSASLKGESLEKGGECNLRMSGAYQHRTTHQSLCDRGWQEHADGKEERGHTREHREPCQWE